MKDIGLEDFSWLKGQVEGQQESREWKEILEKEAL